MATKLRPARLPNGSKQAMMKEADALVLMGECMHIEGHRVEDISNIQLAVWLRHVAENFNNLLVEVEKVGGK